MLNLSASPRLAILAFSALLSASPLAAQCSFSLTPNTASFAAAGGNGLVTIAANASNCARTATSNAPWITVSFGSPGTGNGSVGYTPGSEYIGTGADGNAERRRTDVHGNPGGRDVYFLVESGKRDCGHQRRFGQFHHLDELQLDGDHNQHVAGCDLRFGDGRWNGGLYGGGKYHLRGSRGDNFRGNSDVHGEPGRGEL